MKLKTFILAVILQFFAFNAFALTAEAATTPKLPIKTGEWQFKFYQNGSSKAVTTINYCVNAANTWSTIGIHITGSFAGGWSVDGSTIFFNGTGGEAIQGVALSYIGSIVHNNLITGHYQDFNIDSASPNGTEGTFTATFQTAVCAG